MTTSIPLPLDLEHWHRDIETGPRPVFQAMGTSVTRVGDIGAGNICKICNQLLVIHLNRGWL